MMPEVLGEKKLLFHGGNDGDFFFAILKKIFSQILFYGETAVTNSFWDY
jgi:hypothetical protein